MRNSVSQLFENIVEIPLLSRTEEIDLAKRIECGDLQAKEKLVHHNLRLVLKITRRYTQDDFPIEDAFNEGVTGLIRATEIFDWRKGFRFTTLAHPHITHAVQRAVANKGLTIRKPVSLGVLERRVKRVEIRLATKLGRMPTEKEIARSARIRLAQLKEIRELPDVTKRLSVPLRGMKPNTEGAYLLDIVANDEPLTDEVVEDREVNQTLYDAINQLSPVHKKIVVEHYGLLDDSPRLQREIAKDIGMGKSFVQKHNDIALAELREILGDKLEV